MAVSGGLLAGVRVLDLSIWRPGPYATQLLAELGADVIKVEPPGGDPMRAYPDLFASLHANKRGIELDLKDAAAQARVLELAADADVVVEGYRPGVADRLGVGWDAVRALNPSVIYCSVSGFGQDGELALVPGHDLNYQAYAGVLAPDGGDPVVAAVPIADLSGGMAAALAVCAAVVHRLQSGEGERIDVAMTDVLATWTGAATPTTRDLDERPRGVPGYGTFATADDGWIALGIVTEDHFWRPLCEVLGLDGRGELTFVERVPLLAELQAEIAAAVRARPRDGLVAELAVAGVPAAPVLSRDEMLSVGHLRERNVVVADPWADPAIGYPVKLANQPARRTSAPPALNEHEGAAWAPRP